MEKRPLIKSRRRAVPFGKLPTEYSSLCRFYLPRPIHDEAEYESVREVAEAFAGFEAQMSTDQRDYFELLVSLMQTWEAGQLQATAQTPQQLLHHLMGEHGMTATDLSRVLGASRQLGPMILRGARSITAEHARALGSYFGVPAGAFI